MEDFLANGPVEQILGLMGMILAAAVVLGGFIVFNVMRGDSGGKKTKMKLGSSGKKPAPKQTDDGLNLDVLGKKKAEPEPSLMDLSSRLSDHFDEPDEPAAQVSEPPAAPLQAASDPQTSIAVESTGQPEELLRLLRDAESGELIVEIAGKQYRKLAEITDKKIGTFILQMAAHLLAFTNGMVATAAGVKSLGAVKAGKVPPPVAPPATQTAPQPPQPVYNPSDPPPFVDKRPNQRLAAYQEIKSTFSGPPADAASRKKGGRLLGVLGPSAPIDDAPLLDLASEINKIVQTRLKYTRLSSAARVEITNNPDGGIRIGVDNRVYNSPDEIPDPEIKSLIKDSIREWEQS